MSAGTDLLDLSATDARVDDKPGEDRRIAMMSTGPQIQFGTREGVQR